MSRAVTNGGPQHIVSSRASRERKTIDSFNKQESTTQQAKKRLVLSCSKKTNDAKKQKYHRSQQQHEKKKKKAFLFFVRFFSPHSSIYQNIYQVCIYMKKNAKFTVPYCTVQFGEPFSLFLVLLHLATTSSTDCDGAYRTHNKQYLTSKRVSTILYSAQFLLDSVQPIGKMLSTFDPSAAST